MWMIRNFSVHGFSGQPRLEYLAVEDVAGSKTIYYGETAISSAEQAVLFSSLYDHLGNQLPAQIKSPAILVQNGSARTAFIVGDPTDAGFSIAHGSDVTTTVIANLVIIEMGR